MNNGSDTSDDGSRVDGCGGCRVGAVASDRSSRNDGRGRTFVDSGANGNDLGDDRCSSLERAIGDSWCTALYSLVAE